MYQNIFNGDDTRLRNLPVEFTYSPRPFVGLPQINFSDLARRHAGQALIALGTWIKPRGDLGPSRRQTNVWQGR
ncbi:MAG TPA: hypothetical protein VI688_07430 [Anaerolineales bacterium]|nr:hypothetical protein [Anaerolineales bacterium]